MDITEACRLHKEAMEFADKADFARLDGDMEKMREYSALAYEREQRAADMCDVEPSKSILLKSAEYLKRDALV